MEKESVGVVYSESNIKFASEKQATYLPLTWHD